MQAVYSISRLGARKGKPLTAMTTASRGIVCSKKKGLVLTVTTAAATTNPERSHNDMLRLGPVAFQ